MRQFLRLNVNGYQIWGKSLMLRNSLNKYGRHFSTLKPVKFNQNNREVLKNLMLNLKNYENNFSGKRLLSNFPQKNLLMDFDVRVFPGINILIKNYFHLYILMRFMDGDFTIQKFKQCTTKALEVVTHLISELRFSELEGLLTQKCKAEIEKNLKNWPRQKLSALAVFPQRTMKCFPVEINVTRNKAEEKETVEITLVHLVWLKYSPQFSIHTEDNFMNYSDFFNPNYNSGSHEGGVVHMAAVYNSKFVRECVNGKGDDWIIHAINLECFPNIRTAL